jgi:hypothetical protein
MAISFKGFQPPGFRTKEQPVLTRPECTQIDTEQVKELTEKQLADLGRLWLAKLQGRQVVR